MYLAKTTPYTWTYAIQAHIIQRSTVVSVWLLIGNYCVVIILVYLNPICSCGSSCSIFLRVLGISKMGLICNIYFMVYFAIMSFQFLLGNCFVFHAPSSMQWNLEVRNLYKVGKKLMHFYHYPLFLSITESVLWHTQLLVK